MSVDIDVDRINMAGMTALHQVRTQIRDQKRITFRNSEQDNSLNKIKKTNKKFA